MDLVDYEAIGDPADAGAGAPDPVDQAPAEAAPADPAPDAPADPLAGIDLDALRALAEVAPSLLTRPDTPQQQQVAQTGQDGPPDLDPFDPDSMRSYMAWEREQTINAIRDMVNPIAEHTQQQAANEQQALLKDAAHDTEMRLGEFIDPDTSRQMMLDEARRLFPQVTQRYGMTDRAAEIALEQAHAAVAAREKAIGEAYHERKMNELKTLTGARTEPGTGTAGTEAAGEYKTEAEAAAAFMARLQAA